MISPAWSWPAAADAVGAADGLGGLQVERAREHPQPREQRLLGR